MKIKQNRIYPYPVYSEMNDDYVVEGLKADIDLEYDSDIATIVITPYIADPSVKKLLDDDLAGLYCHVECSSTKYRELFEIDYSETISQYEIKTPLYRLNDVVEVLCVIVTKNEIINFTSENLNSLYNEETITFPKYSTIGFTSTTEFVITKRIDINGDVPSIFAINKDESAKQISYDYSGDQIIIFLPADEYQIYYDYVGQGVRVKQMMINLPVLVDIINSIKTDRASYENCSWFAVLEAAYSKKNFDGFDDRFMSMNSIELAQMILGDISKDAFNEFDKMNRERT